MELPGDVGDEIFILCKTFKQLSYLVFFVVINPASLQECKWIKVSENNLRQK